MPDSFPHNAKSQDLEKKLKPESEPESKPKFKSESKPKSEPEWEPEFEPGKTKMRKQSIARQQEQKWENKKNLQKKTKKDKD